MNEEHVHAPSQHTQVVSTGDWVVTILIAAIPLVNLIMLFVWGFGDNTPASKANWARATLIWMAIGIVLWVLFVLLFGGLMFMGMDS